jgi:hypothetical protein
MMRKNKGAFLCHPFKKMLKIFPPSYQKTLRAHLNKSQYLHLKLMLLLLQTQSILDFRLGKKIGDCGSREQINPSFNLKSKILALID